MSLIDKCMKKNAYSLFLILDVICLLAPSRPRYKKRFKTWFVWSEPALYTDLLRKNFHGSSMRDLYENRKRFMLTALSVISLCVT